MNSPAMTMMRVAMRMAVWIYRLTNGLIGGSLGRLDVLLLTVPGRKSGTPHTVPVGFFEHEGGYLVVGSAGGSPQEPQWFRNLRKSARAHIQIRSRHTDVFVRVTDPAERDRLWNDVVIAQASTFARYQKNTDRTIPIAVLTPV
ncbi:nitroreductase/quinone reductase family protein [Cryobacterium psychrophilum]|uniref:Nitroreductase family deazaflavin-dependent oxidoreductase n=1 Tax=Cryobacterium psychrophilum TaxID=41988 RepID=A0A4Y8KNV4_9MICO|nr:nitroreductase/quinone reductase family protein [Cryobacterium psychrophilum]TDW29281.1 deazaflavin-dependent oxidoreductase (nitroreductase family) [Cryobacterium psychrophilum]TFD79960.1 nitroreductase family deazaflavin-dependent oxidoreductase [Cryobacterium psychrophilum]